MKRNEILLITVICSFISITIIKAGPIVFSALLDKRSNAKTARVALTESGVWDSKSRILSMDNLETAFLDLDTLTTGNSEDADLKLNMTLGTDLYIGISTMVGVKAIKMGMIQPDLKDCQNNLSSFSEHFALIPGPDRYYCVLTNEGSLSMVTFIGDPEINNKLLTAKVNLAIIVWKNYRDQNN